MDKSSFEIGTQASFLYHGEQREGIVEKVTDTCVTLKLSPVGWQSTANVEEQKPYKSFRFDKIGK
jgi:hypothetical protein